MIDADLTVMTYNILDEQLALHYSTLPGVEETPNGELIGNWRQRRSGKVIKNINDSSADILCFQEVSLKTYKFLMNHLGEKVLSGCYAGHKGNVATGDRHGTAIFYNTEKVDLVARYTFSTHGDRWRSAACCDFVEKSTGHKYRVLSVHLKGYDPLLNGKERRESQKVGYDELRLYREMAEQNAGDIDALIIAGDFNEDQYEMQTNINSRQQYLISCGYIHDNVVEETEIPTKRLIEESLHSRKIDWIFIKVISDRLKQMQLDAALYPNQDREASDHLMVGTMICY